jgi:integrase
MAVRKRCRNSGCKTSPRCEHAWWLDVMHHGKRHEALSRLADEGVPVHELQMLAGHANITTTQRYMNARANSLAESMRQARQRRADRLAQQSDDNMQVG